MKTLNNGGTSLHVQEDVTVAAGQSHTSSWISCEGTKELDLMLVNDAATESTVDVEWSYDKVHSVTETDVITAGAITGKLGTTTVKALHARVTVNNGDTAAHTINTFVNLK